MKNRSLAKIQKEMRLLARTTLTFASEKLNELADEVGERARDEWTPVSKSMPEKGRGYIVTYSGEHFGDGESFISMDYFGDDGWEFAIDRVTAWMPAPEPYREDG